MALFTDGPINVSGDLVKYENNILNVASTENIDTTQKCCLAQEEMEVELLLFLDRNVLWDPWFAVLRRNVGICDVVVTGPMKRWHAYKTLELVYRDAYYNQLNDRYQAKWTEYQTISADAARKLFKAGVGMALDPVSKASAPSLTTVAASVSGASYYARASWVSAAGKEGQVSDVVQVTSASGSAIAVGASNPPAGVVSWNVYGGADPNATTLQNAMPLPISSTWTLPVTGLVTGRAPSGGQAPEWWMVDKQILLRG